MNKTKPIKEKKEKQEKTTKPVRLPRSVQQLIPVKRVFPDSIWHKILCHVLNKARALFLFT